MSFVTQCPRCKQLYTVADELLGDVIKCRGCPSRFEIRAFVPSADARLSAPPVQFDGLAPPAEVVIEEETDHSEFEPPGSRSGEHRARASSATADEQAPSPAQMWRAVATMAGVAILSFSILYLLPSEERQKATEKQPSGDDTPNPIANVSTTDQKPLMTGVKVEPKVDRTPTPKDETPEPLREQIESQLATWNRTAATVVAELAEIEDAAPQDATKRVRLRFKIDTLADQTSAVLTSMFDEALSERAPLRMTSKGTRKTTLELTERLRKERSRLNGLSGSQRWRDDWLAILDRCIWPDWLIEEKPVPSKREARTVETGPASPRSTVPGKPRDFRAEAEEAIQSADISKAADLLRAELLAADDATIRAKVLWSPALKRPRGILLWAFGVELNNFPTLGPTNLQPSSEFVRPAERDTATESHLMRQLLWLTGEIGLWLADGLQLRIDRSGFGDWGTDNGKSTKDHRGIALLDFASTDELIEASRSQRADVLIAFALTMSRDEGRPTTSLVARVYDVESGEILTETKPISSTRIAAGRRQGKDYAGLVAGEVLRFVDDELLLRPVPDLSPMAVKDRLAMIPSRGRYNPMASLLELRDYRVAAPLDEAEVKKCVADFVGDEKATQLLSDDRRQRLLAIESLWQLKRPR